MNFNKILYRFKILINPTFLILEKRESSSFFFNIELDDFLNSLLGIPKSKHLTFLKYHFRQNEDSRLAQLFLQKS